VSDVPKVLISYSHDSPEHARRVVELAERLRIDGIDAQLDQYVTGTPLRGWPRWMEDQLDSADFVLVICTETYRRRFLGREEPNKGKGADWEGSLITLELYDARNDTSKFVPVLFDPQDQPFIPRPLSGHTYYLLSSEGHYAKLYDFLTGQSGFVPGKLGPLKTRARVAVEPLRFGNAAMTAMHKGFVRDLVATVILAALAKPAEPAIKDAYDGLKAIIKRKFGDRHEVVQAVENLEKKPDSIGRREMLKEELIGSGAEADAEILATARSLLENLKKQPSDREIVQQIVTGNRNIFSGTGDIHIGRTQS
jgi:SEFIR domain